jgi:uncharacterized membrane protein
MKLRHTKLQVVLEAICATLIIAMFVLPLVGWNTIPDKLPMHFNAAGEIDRMGNKDGLIVLPVVGVILYGLCTFVSFILRVWTIPSAKQDDRTFQVFRDLTGMIIFMKTELLVFFLIITLSMMYVRPLPAIFTPGVYLIVFATLIYYIIRIVRHSRAK